MSLLAAELPPEQRAVFVDAVVGPFARRGHFHQPGHETGDRANQRQSQTASGQAAGAFAAVGEVASCPVCA